MKTVDEAARRISRGPSSVTVVTGAEALASPKYSKGSLDRRQLIKLGMVFQTNSYPRPLAQINAFNLLQSICTCADGATVLL